MTLINGGIDKNMSEYPKMRSSLVERDVLNETIEFIERNDFEARLSNHREKFDSVKAREGFYSYDLLIENYALLQFEGVAFTYTRGDALTDIEKNYVQPSIPRILQTCAEIEKYNLKGKVFFWGSSFTEQGHIVDMRESDVLNALVFMSYCLSFNIEKTTIQKIIPFLVPPGASIIVDAVLSNYDDSYAVKDTELYTTNDYSEMLYAIYCAPPTEQTTLINTYLDSWAKTMATQRSDSKTLLTLGHYVKHAHKTNRTLQKDVLGKYPLYRGHWAWEIVCLVKLLNINDSDFRGHQFYPVDMVDFG